MLHRQLRGICHATGNVGVEFRIEIKHRHIAMDEKNE